MNHESVKGVRCLQRYTFSYQHDFAKFIPTRSFRQLRQNFTDTSE